MKLTAEQRKKAKGEGFLSNRDGEHFSARIITGNGVLDAAQLRNLSQAAETYGNGKITFTSRMTLEVAGICYENIEPFKAFVAKEKMYTGGTGAKVRPVVACKGTVCVFGLIDTQKLGQEIHERFFEGYDDVTLPHKFKIAVGGCPNNCVKPDLNDLGIVGQRVQKLQEDLCRGCKKCIIASACPMNAIEVQDKRAQIDREICNNCGRCAENCPFKAMPAGENGYKIYIGGRWGKKTRVGNALPRIFTHDEVLDMVEKAILLFKREGTAKERFGSMIDRLGTARVEEVLFSDELLEQKEGILSGEIHGLLSAEHLD